MKNSADLGECYPPQPSASVDNTLLDLQNSSYPIQPHSIIAKYILGDPKFLQIAVFKKQKTFSVFLSSYRNTSGGLGEREMLWEHEPQASVSTAFSGSSKPSRVFL